MYQSHLIAFLLTAMVMTSKGSISFPGIANGMMQLMNHGFGGSRPGESPMMPRECDELLIPLLREIIEQRSRAGDDGGVVSAKQYYMTLHNAIVQPGYGCEVDVLREVICLDKNRNGQMEEKELIENLQN
ncbi:hypothetical protein SNE40_020269 [Patella caerulea]|uniref:EF-hand domain-containing protein n=1 Tax=Patella caerulea TaxID=87958 RepID=A0AAN8GJX9_PATCE